MKEGNKNSRYKSSIALNKNSETGSNYESDYSFEFSKHNRNKLTKTKEIYHPKTSKL